MKPLQALLLASTFLGLLACGAPDVPDVVPPGIPPESSSTNKDPSTRDKTSSPSRKDEGPSSTTDDESTNNDGPVAPRGEGPAPGFPRAANLGECTLGDGLYCGGNGVDGATGTLYRCAGGTIDEEMKCATSCLFFADGKNDACDGTVSACPLGNGLYCGGNRLSGDARTLFRCRKGTVTIEQTCANTCVQEADGLNDRCE